MKDVSRWEQFMSTGKIEDFLAYRNAVEEERTGETKASEEDSHGGDHRDHGDGFKG